MAYPAYVREKARKLRVEKHLSIDEIADRLALPKTTIYYWVRDLPLGRPRKAHRNGSSGVRAKSRLRRTAGYALGRLEFARLRAIRRSATSCASTSEKARSGTAIEWLFVTPIHE
jgi:transposase-like protein